MERGDKDSHQRIQQRFASQPNNVDELEENEFSNIRQEMLKKEFDFTDVQQICSEHQIEIKDLKTITGSFGKKIF